MSYIAIDRIHELFGEYDNMISVIRIIISKLLRHPLVSVSRETETQESVANKLQTESLRSEGRKDSKKSETIGKQVAKQNEININYKIFKKLKSIEPIDNIILLRIDQRLKAIELPIITINKSVNIIRYSFAYQKNRTDYNFNIMIHDTEDMINNCNLLIKNIEDYKRDVVASVDVTKYGSAFDDGLRSSK
jgi:hypothetical protein